ncbi:MAG: phosphoribosylglycinamide formyltransferase [Deltaproteobacteria bacterium]|nr:phosphoribosylglycinamide formyltransferase [Deltaproteobacteria bacterium]
MSDKTRIAVLASGRGSNFVSIADAIKRDEINAEIVLLICNKPDAGAIDAARFRGIEVKILQSKGVPAPEYDEKLVQVLKSCNPDLIVLAGYMKIVGKQIIDAFPMKIINIHPALLPSFPGLDAQKQAFDYGVKVTGCTVHFVDEGVDTGPVILQKSVLVDDDDTAETLSKRILAEEHRLYPEAIRLFSEGKLKIEGRRVIIERS